MAGVLMSGLTVATVLAATAYNAPFASPARSSFVSVPYHENVTALQRVAALEGAAQFVLIASDHIVVDFGTRIEIRDRAGILTAQFPNPDHVPIGLVGENVLLNTAVDFAGRPSTLPRKNGEWQSGDRVWAFDATAAYTTYAAVHTSRPRMYHATNGGKVSEIFDRTRETLSIMTHGFPDQWVGFNGRNFTGFGCAAIAADRRVAVAMANGDFFVLDSKTPTKEAAPLQLTASKLPFGATDISLVSGGSAIALLEIQTLHLVDWHGHEIWQVGIERPATMPAIDGGEGRVYVVGGQGIAAVQQGKVIWSHAASVPSFATAVDEGVVFFASGHTLQAFDKAGAVLEQWQAPQGEVFVTPPAVSGDGRIAIATNRALYTSALK
jgi:hypothetical protein